MQDGELLLVYGGNFVHSQKLQSSFGVSLWPQITLPSVS